VADKSPGKRITPTAECRADIEVISNRKCKQSGVLKPAECKLKGTGNPDEEDIGAHRVFRAKNGKL